MPGVLTRPASRTAQVATAVILAFLLALAVLAPARAGDLPTTTDPALAAAGWIAQQVETDPSLGVGSLADAIFAFAAVGAGQAAADTALAGMAANLDGFVMPGGVVAPGALAKVLLAVQVQGADPTAFGGHDLEAELRALLIGGGPDAGRFGTASIFDQSLAVLALARTSGGVPASAVTWLGAGQCPSGEFSFDGSCPAGPGAEDPDTTATALQALLAGGATTDASEAVSWLLSIQQPDGGFPSFGIANTNSSGVAGQALRAAGETSSADAAAAFVTSLALGCDADPAEIGAIGWAVGIPGFLIFSTPQAVLTFGAPPLDQLSAIGASEEAPVLECASTGPVPTPSPSDSLPPATPAPSADEGELPDTSTGAAEPASWETLAALAVAAAAALVTVRRRRAVS
ncbi:MAG TPA: prenyltransferase/squalene oxidase repeat-containing protein [Candidatus Limnocylindrales bacterium]